MIAIFFYLMALTLLSAGLCVVFAKNPIHSVFALILAFFNAAGLFILVRGELLAMILVVVYVGAVAVLFLFVVMMLEGLSEPKRFGSWTRFIPMAAMGGILGAEMVTLGWAWPHLEASRAWLVEPMPASLTSAQALGRVLYTDYATLFQLAGLTLLVAIIGAILLTHRQREGVKRQKIAEQLARQPTSVQLHKIPLKKGVPWTSE